jgi:ergothioneine biosynthesis protein EgtB
MSSLDSKYKAVRSMTRSLLAGLSAEDQTVQSSPETSPLKWHQAHTTWFFETFVLRPFLPGYKPFREEFHRLFNSDYAFAGDEFSGKKLRAAFSRPSLDEVLAFRTHVDEGMEKLLVRSLDAEASRRVILGLNHEQRHQELALADIKHAFFSNPLHPSYRDAPPAKEDGRPSPKLSLRACEGGLIEIGHSPCAEEPLAFCFDNETPRHRVYLQPFQIANRNVTCREYLEFMSDDAYTRRGLWLCDGWEMVRQGEWEAPLYWERDSGDETGWHVFTLCGWHGLSTLFDTPVCHISFYEAEAFARWRGYRLPTEAEWESVACQKPCHGNLLEAGGLHPVTSHGSDHEQFFGDCWQWTASPFSCYPGYKPMPGALDEYDGKITPGQMTLRGGSCVTPADHVRATYRNFFPPAARWQFTGIRLAA